MTEPFFHVDGDRFLPTLLCQGPWDPGSAHGGPPSALLARAIERHEPDDTLVIARVILDLVRPVPLARATGWFRLIAPLVDGEEPSPVQRAMVAADFGNGISQVLGDGFVFINPDLVVHFEREPVGEWVALAATTRLTPGRSALATGTLYDTIGRIGRSEQSLYVGPRPPA